MIWWILFARREWFSLVKITVKTKFLCLRAGFEILRSKAVYRLDPFVATKPERVSLIFYKE